MGKRVGTTAVILATAAAAAGVAVVVQKKYFSKAAKEETKTIEAAATAVTEHTSLKNSAFVFIKPHANTAKAQELVKAKLIENGITILSECDITGPEIDSKKLIDQHYYAIASKATLLTPDKLPVPAEKFEAEFGEKWSKVLEEKRAVNAMDACERFGVDAAGLNDAWGKAKKVVKFGGGFYCGLVSVGDKSPLYVFNAFFMSMRSKFVGKDDAIHCYVVEFSADKLSWEDFRGKVLGPTDPAEAPVGSIRRTILDTYKELDLKSLPNKGDNGVHASASPFEGLAEKANWLGGSIEEDSFGKALIDAGLTLDTIKEWSVDPQVELPGGGKGSVFDALEDMNADDCLKKLGEINAVNAMI
uniref:Nucleoside-diphosphate kinase n=1 Tax=Ditylum brightwellii TaxID=49249 RepID=A0A7S4SLT1_9STRA|mmetsp:Transcript_13518/g.18131  ORF Transcript_13518/g.18131 Transcript_13518/m.18131 type:complete len:359 (-) Transcript_13518:58-1134(-)